MLHIMYYAAVKINTVENITIVRCRIGTHVHVLLIYYYAVEDIDHFSITTIWQNKILIATLIKPLNTVTANVQYFIKANLLKCDRSVNT